MNINAVVPGRSPAGTNVVSSQSGAVPLSRNPESFEYDLDGNLLFDGIWVYTWDAENRLTQMKFYLDKSPGPETQLDFKYDALGRRISKTMTKSAGKSVVTKYVYDGWNLVAELDVANGLVRSYLWGTDLSGSPQGAGGVGGLLAIRNASPKTSDYFVACDGNGNVSALVNANSNTVSAAYEYGPFGELIRTTGPMAQANPFRWSTKYQDTESGLSYYGYRYYNPNTGRWLSRDPIEEEGGLNLYGMVGNDTINLVDPLGLASLSIKMGKAELRDCGQFKIPAYWVIFPASHGAGQIVQSVTITERIAKCGEKKLPEGRPFKKQEAFPIFIRKGAGLVPGGDAINVSDTFASNSGTGCDWGEIVIEASAVFYEDGKLPPAFRGNPRTGSGILLSVLGHPYLNPSDFGVGVSGASDPASRRVKITWNCCEGSQSRKSVDASDITN